MARAGSGAAGEPTRGLLFVLCLLTFASPAWATEAGHPGYRLLAPLGRGLIHEQWGLVFRDVSTSEQPIIHRVLDESPAVREVLRRYHAVRAVRGRPPRPLILILLERGQDVSFCWFHPMAIWNGGIPELLAAPPAVHLTSGTLADFRNPGSGGGWALETVCHETGHAIMEESLGVLGYPDNTLESLVMLLRNEGHWLGKRTDSRFAFSEGWAEYVSWSATGAELDPSHLADGKGQALDPTTLRQSEAAVASVLLGVERAKVYEDGMGAYLRAFEQGPTDNLDQLLATLRALEPERAPRLDEALRDLTKGALPAPQLSPKEDRARSLQRLRDAARSAVRDPLGWLRRFRQRLGR